MMAKFMVIPERCLQLMGHSFGEASHHRNRIWLQLAGVLTVAMAFIPLTYYAVFYRNTLQLATESLSVAFTNGLTVLKITTFLLYKEKYLNVVRKIKKISSDRNREELRQLADANQWASVLIRMYLIATSCTGLYFMVTPLAKYLYSKLLKKEFIKELPMKMKFPFDETKSPAYEIIVGYTALATIIVVLYATSIDGIFLSISLNLSEHFKILQKLVEEITFTEDERQSKGNFESFVTYHNKVLTICQDLRDIYKPIIFGQFFITSLLICVIGYQLVTNIQHFCYVVIYVTFLAAVMIQLFIYCYGGEIITNQSGNISSAVYLSEWHVLSPQLRKDLIFLIQRSQRNFVVSVGFYEASLANFMIVLKAALSYITLVQSIDIKQ